jgi:hypothetical protein
MPINMLVVLDMLTPFHTSEVDGWTDPQVFSVRLLAVLAMLTEGWILFFSEGLTV